MSEKGLGAVFDMIEGDDDGTLSWKEFEAFFMGHGWGTYTGTSTGASAGVGGKSEDSALRASGVKSEMESK